MKTLTQARGIVTIALLILLSTVLAAPVASQGPGEAILYQEDFNNGKAQGWDPDKFFNGIASHSLVLSRGAWHNVEIVGQGARIVVSTDGATILDYTDPQPVVNGSIAFESLDNAKVEIDDVTIIGPAPTCTLPPPPPPPDTTPPNISNLSANPTMVVKQGPGCPNSSRTTTVSATVTDAGGVRRVVARVPGVGEVEMTLVGGNVYRAVLGPFDYTGELSIIILAWDNAGNAASAGPLTVLVVACIG
jgi:hypothetical protein